MGTLPTISESEAGFDDARGVLARMGDRGLRRRDRPLTPLESTLAGAIVGAVVARALSGSVADLSRVVAEARAAVERAMRTYVARLDKSTRTPLDTWRVAAPLDLAATQYLDQWARDARTRLDALVQLYAARGETPQRLLHALDAAFALEWAQVRRVLRTESARSANATAVDAVRVMARAHPDVRKRWVELIDDQTGVPLDDRVANDSLVMHGQVAPWDGLFTMPRARIVHERMWGQQWNYPPNRPNDRAVIMPWRPGWGVPGWEFSDGKRRVLVAGVRADQLAPEGFMLAPHADDE